MKRAYIVRRAILMAPTLLVASLLGACDTMNKPRPRPVVEVAEDPEWRRIASPEDAIRIDRLQGAWQQALQEARAKGFGRAIAAEGDLLRPAGALLRPEPTPGPYRCRTIKLGTQKRGSPAFVAYKPFFCYVEAEGTLLTIVKQTGSERPAGRLYPDSHARRAVFLGTLALGTEDAPLPYGARPARDLVGIMERIAPFRFRMVIPWPRQESKLDVIEMRPVIE